MMKNTAFVAAALLALTLAGCAATNGNGTSGASPVPRAKAAAGSTLYCMDGKFVEGADGYRCAWAGSQKEACSATLLTVVPKEAVASGPTKGGMCAHGDRITYLVTR
jgi:hypothetical protein